MALLRMMTTVNPSTSTSVVGGSAFFVYDTDRINWQTLASKTGAAGISNFDYTLQGGGIGKATVKASPTTITASAGAITIPTS
jgi:hypothetical protein